MDRLWSDATVPRSWTVDKGPAGLAAARSDARARESARGEREPAESADYRRDDLSKTSSQIPRGVVDIRRDALDCRAPRARGGSRRG